MIEMAVEEIYTNLYNTLRQKVRIFAFGYKYLNILTKFIICEVI